MKYVKTMVKIKRWLMFFNSIFLSIDAQPTEDENSMYQIPDKSEPYNIQLMNMYLVGLLKKHLTDKEFEVLRLSYGLDCRLCVNR